MKFFAFALLIGGVFWLIKKRDAENQTEKAGEKQNTLNLSPNNLRQVNLANFVGPVPPGYIRIGTNAYYNV